MEYRRVSASLHSLLVEARAAREKHRTLEKRWLVEEEAGAPFEELREASAAADYAAELVHRKVVAYLLGRESLGESQDEEVTTAAAIWAEMVATDLSRLVAQADRPSGGMQVPDHHELASAARLPSVVTWARRALRTLADLKASATNSTISKEAEEDTHVEWKRTI
jgi:hypothetical protein